MSPSSRYTINGAIKKISKEKPALSPGAAAAAHNYAPSGQDGKITNDDVVVKDEIKEEEPERTFIEPSKAFKSVYDFPVFKPDTTDECGTVLTALEYFSAFKEESKSDIEMADQKPVRSARPKRKTAEEKREQLVALGRAHRTMKRQLEIKEAWLDDYEAEIHELRAQIWDLKDRLRGRDEVIAELWEQLETEKAKNRALMGGK